MKRENPAPRVSCTYGAPMGRRSYCQGDGALKISLQRVPINSGGYDRGGAYWGIGSPLYWAGDAEGEVDMYFRARTRDAAKAHVREMLPGARFYR